MVYIEGHNDASDLVSLSRFDSLVDLCCPDLDGTDDAESDGFYEASLFKNQVSKVLLSFFQFGSLSIYHQLFVYLKKFCCFCQA